MSYKDSLNLPKTEFSMKANLPCLEPNILKTWEGMNLYNKILDSSYDEEDYILHDGPPYANGDIHAGHALNKSLKDIIVKFMTMKGRKSIFVPGWDCHGLPVEYALFKSIDKTKHEVDILDFRKKAHEYAMKYVDIQRKEFKRLGVFGLWDKPYLTLNSEYEYAMLKALARLVEKGYIYRGLRPVNWCSSCETALAEAEVEYEMKESPSICVKFPLPQAGVNTYLLVWTTTPWTLLGNVACAFNPELSYVKFFDSESENYYIAAEPLLKSVLEKSEIKEYKIEEKFKGKDLKYKAAKHPFLDRDSKLIFADFVSEEEGTGCVHIAPGHGEEDYYIGKEYDLSMYMPVDDKGKFVARYNDLNKDLKDNDVFCQTPDWLVDKNVFKANNLIIDKLKSDSKLLYEEKIMHSYPACWRCKMPVIFRATKQWFMRIDHNNLRDNILKFADQIMWVPSISQKRFSEMVNNRPDWCLSRQRLWGVPIPAFRCKDCDQDIILADAIDEIADLVKESGSDIWFKKDLKELLPESIKCSYCDSSNLEKLNDIIDVWFESGISHLAVLNKDNNLSYPADLYLEGSDQHRGWFQSSLITSVAISEKTPFKTILTHGFVVDAEGKKMSKSKGNVVSPLDVFSKYGADILRLWTISCDYTSDVRISDQIISSVAEAYRKVRNTIKFLLGNLYDFSFDKEVEYESLLEIDKWMLLRTAKMVEYVEKQYKSFDFYKIYRYIYDFYISDLSSFYLDVLKDRIYVFKKDSLERRSAQSVFYQVLIALVKVIAPVMPFTAEEVWQHLPKDIKIRHKDSVHLEKFPDVNKTWMDEKLDRKWERLITIREDVLKALEVEREKSLIGSSLDAMVTLYTDEEDILDFFNGFDYEIKYIFIISEFKLVKVDKLSEVRDFTLESSNIKIKVEKSQADKCQRCWNYDSSVGENKKLPDLCKRCIEQL